MKPSTQEKSLDDNIEHTPTPWTQHGTMIVGADDWAVADLYLKNLGPVNAEHIVRCVNTHDMLVAALNAIKGSAQYLRERREYTDLPVEYMAEISGYIRIADGALNSAVK